MRSKGRLRGARAWLLVQACYACHSNETRGLPYATRVLVDALRVLDRGER